MKLTIVTDKTVYKYKGKFYTTGGFLFQVSAFKAKFEEIEIVTNIKNLDFIEPKYLEFDDCFSFCDVSGDIYVKIKKMKGLISNLEYVQLRLPSKNGYLFGNLFRNMDKNKTNIYLGGHPEQGVVMTRGNNLKNRFIGKISGRLTSNIVKKYKTFVTGGELKAYFDMKKLDVEQIISTSITNADVVNEIRTRNPQLINIVFIGRLSREKGMEFLLDFIENSNFPMKIYFHFIGEGPLKDLIIKMSQKNSYIKYHGGIYERGHLFKLLSEMDIFLLPSLSEGTPKVIIEAMSQGIPVIASRVGGIPSVINEGENGILFESENAKELYSSIELLISNNELYEKFSREGIKLARMNSLESLNEKFFPGVK